MNRNWTDQEIEVLNACLAQAGVPEADRRLENPYLMKGPRAKAAQDWAIEISPAVAKKWQSEADAPQGLMAIRIQRGLRDVDKTAHEHLMGSNAAYRVEVEQRRDEQYEQGLKWLEQQAEAAGRRNRGDARFEAEKAQQAAHQQRLAQMQQQGQEVEQRIAAQRDQRARMNPSLTRSN